MTNREMLAHLCDEYLSAFKVNDLEKELAVINTLFNFLRRSAAANAEKGTPTVH